jgi:flavin reductase (DIM6/NTAB) family NADH-FMN oxidoreductase RutF
MGEATGGGVDPRELRRTLGQFVTGVTIVTVRDERGLPRGLTANSFTSVSLDPPLILVCIASRAPSRQAFDAAPGFAVNILGEAQRDVSARFASPVSDKFAGLSWRPGASGAPLLERSLAYLDCRTHRRIEAGDHVILIGEVTSFDRNEQSPLAFCRGAYVSVNLPPIRCAEHAGDRPSF